MYSTRSVSDCSYSYLFFSFHLGEFAMKKTNRLTAASAARSSLTAAANVNLGNLGKMGGGGG
jgi:hypothetical protein